MSKSRCFHLSVHFRTCSRALTLLSHLHPPHHHKSGNGVWDSPHKKELKARLPQMWPYKKGLKARSLQTWALGSSAATPLSARVFLQTPAVTAPSSPQLFRYTSQQVCSRLANAGTMLIIHFSTSCQLL